MTTVIVLGAGMVGVSTGLALLDHGHDVVLVDRGEPGGETSFGNAGVIQAEAVEPYALPRDFRSLFRIALGRGNDVHYHVAALPGQAVALWQYYLAARPDRHLAAASAYAPMIRRSTADHQALIAAANADNLIRRDGLYQIYRSPRRFDAAQRKAELVAHNYGVGVETVSDADMRHVEPALRGTIAGAVRWTDSWNCIDPGGLVASYARLFEARGGSILSGDASTLQTHLGGWTVSTTEGGISAQNAVVALGPWSPELLRRFGCRIRMVYKRGYHRHFANVGGLRITMHDTEVGTVLAPMRAGLRITTGVELAAANARPTSRQLDRAVTQASRLIEVGAPVDEAVWSGTRPCLPGMLPFVGPLPGHKTLWGNFGHGHQGFTLGPTTGIILSEQLSNAQT